MRLLRKGVRRSVLAIDQCFRVLIILALLLQPVGTSGWYGVFVFHKNISAAETVDESSDESEAQDEEASEEEEAEEEAEEKAQEASEKDEALEEKSEEAQADKEDSQEAIVESETDSTTDSPEVTPSTEAPEENGEGDGNEGEVSDGTTRDASDTLSETSSDTETVIEAETPSDTTENEPLPEGIPEEDEDQGIPEAEVVEDEREIWEKDGNSYTTVDPVQVGVVYEAPQNEEVKITFTRLPALAGTVTVKEVKLSFEERQLLGALTDTAYDITSSMENGSFAYELVLPIPEGKDNVQVKYIESDEDWTAPVTVRAEDMDLNDDTVKVELDHFTLFIATYGNASFTVEQNSYTPGETVYTKAGDLNPSKFYRIYINPPTGSSFRISEPSCFNPDESTTTLTASYVLPSDASISNSWSADLKEYTNAGCTGVTTIQDTFSVVAEVVEETLPPENESENFDVTICHATPPDTAASGYNTLTVDDDSIFVTGHASEHEADIIPPFESGDLSFPGKNWNALGQAIWENGCTAVGQLQVVKLVDDASDVTDWVFQLDGESPLSPNMSGLVDFGYVSVGEHTLIELGTLPYSLASVTGENCAWDEETNQVTATIVAGETTICTFSNAVDKASITVVKDTLPDDAQDFSFFLNEVKMEPLILDDDGNTSNERSNIGTITNLFPGTYTLTEASVEGWVLEDIVCSSSREVMLDVPATETITLTLLPGETVTCTYTNEKIVSNGGDDPYCGDGVINQESEECDGTDGVSEGENFCTFSCKLVPTYDGGGSCEQGTEPVLVSSYFVSGTSDPDGREPISIPLQGGKDYLLEATGTYSYGGIPIDTSLNLADAGYSSSDAFAGPTLVNDLFGITSGAYYRGVHTLLSDLGTGTLGVVDWGSYRSDHTYPLAMSPGSDTEVEFVISDWYDEWYTGDWLSEPNKNQQGFRDNAGGLTVNVYECEKPATGSITVVKDAEPNDAQNFGFVLNPGFQEFVLDDDSDPLLSDSESFTDLPAGMYTVTEGLVPGWELELVTCVSDQRSLLPTTEPIRTIELLAGENITCTFTNVAKNGSITIVKDATPDDAQNFGYAMNGESFLEFVLDDDSDPLLSNTATFTSLTPGTYTVTEGLVPGWTLENISCTSNQKKLTDSTEPIRTIELTVGESVTCTFFNTRTEDIPVCGNGVIDVEGEQCDGTAGVTPGENFCTFSCKLVPIYDGGGVCGEGKTPVKVASYFVDAAFVEGVVPAPVSVPLAGGKEYVIEASGTFGYGGIPIDNVNHRADAAYVTDTNFAGPNLDTLFGSPATALYRGIHNLISDFGTGTFGVVDWGTYNPGHVYTQAWNPVANTNVQFAISDWYDTWYSGDELSNFNQNQFGFRDNDGGLDLTVYECQEDEEVEPRLILSKFNNSVSDEVPGNEVTYTLQVTAVDGPVDDVTVTDLPPEGFEYIAGSGEGAPFIHEYASPGIWDLGDMLAGETKTLTYKTKISTSQDAGLYEDLAFAKGVSGSSTLFANAPSDPFVGTDVNVVLPVSNPVVTLDEDEDEETEKKKRTKTQYVLGAATALPETGTPLAGVMLGFAGIALGLLLRRMARRSVAKSGALLTLLFGLGLALAPGQAEGAMLSVEIETPKAVINDPNFKLGFVTLDTLNRPLTVKCYTTLSATPFASYALESSFGGNSGDCEVNSSVLPTDGNYEFFVRATATGEGGETVESNHVDVTLISGVPGTPLNYEREDPACNNVITFTTANDGGKTVKVELYRSTENPFVASAATKMAETALGSNVNGSFSVGAPGCDDDVFYAIRAVAASGLGSSFVGDTDEDTRTTTVTTTTTNTVTVPGAPVGAIPVSSETGTGESVAGAATEAAVQGAATAESEGEATQGVGEEGAVLGEAIISNEATWFDEHPILTGLLALLAVVIGVIGYTRFLARRP